MLPSFAFSVFLLPSFAQRIPADSVASTFSLTTSTSFPFPTATQNSEASTSFIVSQWSLSRDKIQNNPQNIEFVDDPFPNKPPPSTVSSASTGPVLRITYPQGSYSHGTGGTQFINLWNTSDGSIHISMLMSYEVAFDTNFDWVKGGKLPGIRGGLSSTGCSGGKESDGTNCFSSRLMWREGGAGEVYAYIPTTDGLCNEQDVICNNDFGTSLSRGKFTFTAGQWNRITMLVQLNSPPSSANGNIQLYFNDALAINQTGLQIRTRSSLAANGLFFSTFFGGSNVSYATPQTTHTYYRNFRLWGGSARSAIPSTAAQNTGVQCERSFGTLIFTLVAAIYQLI